MRGGAGVRLSAMTLVDLRQMSARALEPLFEEEARHWREELHWDYRGSLELIKRFVEAKSLAGCVAMEDGRPVGYGFYVVEEHKGLVGGMYVRPGAGQASLSRQVLGDMTATLRGVPRLERIEAQLMPFGCELDGVLLAEGFRLYTRQFMLLELERAEGRDEKLGASRAEREVQLGPVRLEPWQEKHFEPCAKLIWQAYAGHVDSEINDQYQSESGAMRFLKNIIVLPGCGLFQAEASFVARDVATEHMVGVVLTSAVAPGVGHTTQVCVLPGYRGMGLGGRLMETSIEALSRKKFKELSLTVTRGNRSAVELYDRLGFRMRKAFAAGVWEGE